MKTAHIKASAFVLVGFVGVIALRCNTRPDPVPEPVLEARSTRGAVPDALRLRLFAKDYLAHEVIAGRRSLVEAAALFRALDQSPPERVARDEGPADLVGERYCNEVVLWIGVAVQMWSREEQKSVLACFEGLVNEVRNDLGQIVLPELDSIEAAERVLAEAVASLTPKQRNDLLGD